MILVDSDVLIEVLRGRDDGIIERWRWLGNAGTPILYSAVTAAELWAGIRPSEQKALTTLFDKLTCVPTDSQIGRRAGEYLQKYRRSYGIELADAVIAASAATLGVELWTRNRKHFPMSELMLFE